MEGVGGEAQEARPQRRGRAPGARAQVERRGEGERGGARRRRRRRRARQGGEHAEGPLEERAVNGLPLAVAGDEAEEALDGLALDLGGGCEGWG